MPDMKIEISIYVYRAGGVDTAGLDNAPRLIVRNGFPGGPRIELEFGDQRITVDGPILVDAVKRAQLGN